MATHVSTQDELQTLRNKVAGLRAENSELRGQIAAISHQHGGDHVEELHALRAKLQRVIDWLRFESNSGGGIASELELCLHGRMLGNIAPSQPDEAYLKEDLEESMTREKLIEEKR